MRWQPLKLPERQWRLGTKVLGRPFLLEVTDYDGRNF